MSNTTRPLIKFEAGRDAYITIQNAGRTLMELDTLFERTIARKQPSTTWRIQDARMDLLSQYNIGGQRRA